MLLRDKLAIVTGAGSARGIGRAAARRFAEQGARVALLDLMEIDPAESDLVKDVNLRGNVNMAQALPTMQAASARELTMADRPGSFSALRAQERTWQARRREDGLDPVTASAVRLAADGLWMNDLFGIEVLFAEERTRVAARLEEMTRR